MAPGDYARQGQSLNQAEGAANPRTHTQRRVHKEGSVGGCRNRGGTGRGGGANRGKGRGGVTTRWCNGMRAAVGQGGAHEHTCVDRVKRGEGGVATQCSRT